MTARPWLLALLLGGCSAIPQERTNVADGRACEASKECLSRSCANGYCAGRSCDVGDPGSCDPGWRCTSFKGSFFTSGSVECVPLCGKCPANEHCPVGGEEGVTACEDGPPRKVTVTGPARVKVGAEVTFAVTVIPPFPEVLRVEWLVGEKAGQGKEFGPDSTPTTTKLDVGIEADLVVTAIVHGKVGPNQFESAGGSLTIHSECLALGDVCDADGEGYDHARLCCAQGLYCPGVANSTAPRTCVVDE